jgi:SAM-dependent methyltransferase
MIDHGHPRLSIVRQCALVSISCSSFYREPTAEREQTLRLGQVFSKFLYYRPRLEAALSELDKSRLKLPALSLRRLFPDFDQRPVCFDILPLGPWSSPLADVAMLIKIAVCARTRNVLEVGSYRGYTTLMLARHLEPGARIVAVDVDPRHGEAYQGHERAALIERRVTPVCSEAFACDRSKSYDLIFLDADHSYQSVKHDTETLLPMLSDDGYFVWHDYGNWGRFSGKNGVPEYLHELSAYMPVASVAGSWLGIHSPAWRRGEHAEAFGRALFRERDTGSEDPWTTADLRR